MSFKNHFSRLVEIWLKWYFALKIVLPTVIKYFFLQILGLQLRISKGFFNHWKGERSVQFLKHNIFLTCSFWFFRTNVECMSSGDLQIWRNFKFWSTNICYYLLSAPQNWGKESLICQHFFVGPIRYLFS